MLLGAPALDDAEAVELGQHEIDDGGVVGVFGAELAALLAIGADIDHIAGFAQAFGNKGGDFRVIFKEKNFHELGRNCLNKLTRTPARRPCYN